MESGRFFFGGSCDEHQFPTPNYKKWAPLLGGGVKHFLFSPLLRERIQFEDHIFQMGWNHQLANEHDKMLGTPYKWPGINVVTGVVYNHI